MKKIAVFNKLVRDNIVEVIHKNNKSCSFHYADTEEYKEKLLEKLLEEAKEFILEKNIEELADILEVIDSILVAFEFDKDEVTKIKNNKSLDKGKFNKKIILEEVCED
jgi:Uncharacterized conserved protein